MLTNNKPFLTIGTTCYNGGKFLTALLDSLKNQETNPDLFEWLIIDNASTDNSKAIIEEIIDLNHDLNIRFISLDANRGPGGGRNAIFDNANGDWIIMVDADDTLVPDILNEFIGELKKSEDDLEVIEFSVVNYNWDSHEQKSTLFKKNETRCMRGREFIQTQEFDWGPWSRAYKKSYLQRMNLKFAENEILDSPDFSIASVLNATKIRYWPKNVLRYSVWEGQNSSVILGNVKLTESAYKRSMRMREIAEKEMKIDPMAANAVLAHHHFCQLANHKYYLWHLGLNDIIRILKEYPAYLPTKSKVLSFSSKNPVLTGVLIWCSKPLLSLARNIYVKLRK